MSKRYSGKSFKDSSFKKKPKLSFKEKENLNKKSKKIRIKKKILNYSSASSVFLSFQK